MSPKERERRPSGSGEKRASASGDHRHPKSTKTEEQSASPSGNQNRLANSRPHASARGSGQSQDDDINRQLQIAAEELQKVQRMLVQSGGPSSSPDRDAAIAQKLTRECEAVIDQLKRTRLTAQPPAQPPAQPQDSDPETRVRYNTVVLAILRSNPDPKVALAALKDKVKPFLQARQQRGPNMLNDEAIRQFEHAIQKMEAEIRDLNRPNARRTLRDLTIPASPRRHPAQTAISGANSGAAAGPSRPSGANSGAAAGPSRPSGANSGAPTSPPKHPWQP